MIPHRLTFCVALMAICLPTMSQALNRELQSDSKDQEELQGERPPADGAAPRGGDPEGRRPENRLIVPGDSPPPPGTRGDLENKEWPDFDKYYPLPSPGEIARMDSLTAKQKLQDATTKESKELGNALSDFKKGAGLGVTVTPGDNDQVEEAFVVDGKIVATKENTNAARMMFEFHQLFTTNILTRQGRQDARDQLAACQVDPLFCPMFGIGPFVALQVSDDNAVSSVGVGIMFGVRNDPRKDTSFNFGIGVQWDSKVKKLAKGFEIGQPLPNGEEEIRFIEKGEARLMFGISLGF